MNWDNWRTTPRPPAFFGRAREIEWLLDLFRRPSHGVPIVICGSGGIGKTTLLWQFLSEVRTRQAPLLMSANHRPDRALAEINARTDESSGGHPVPEIVAIDEADGFDTQHLSIIAGHVFNFKAVRMLIFVMRNRPDDARAEVLELGPLSSVDSEYMLDIQPVRNSASRSPTETATLGPLPSHLNLKFDT